MIDRIITRIPDWLVAAALVLLLCAVPAEAELLARYSLSVTPDLTTADITVRTLHPRATRLVAPSGDGRRVQQARSCAGGSWRTLSGRSRAWRVQQGECLRYRVALAPMNERMGQGSGQDWIMSNPNAWLWLPRLAGADQVALSVTLPAGVQMSAPWQPSGDQEYRIGASPRSGNPMVLFGRFLQMDLYPVPGLGSAGPLVQVAHPPTRAGALSAQRLRRWLAGPLQAVAAVADGFPIDPLQVIVLAVDSDDASAVPFGHVVRNQGAAVRFFVDPHASDAALAHDWTASHEFAHLLVPYVSDKWLSEGIASYYQNILQARLGAYDEEQMWRRLTRSFARAAQIADPPPAAGLETRSFWEVRMLVYWLGAALALQSDVALREASHGRQSLDSLLAQLQRCCATVLETWSAAQLFAQLHDFAPNAGLQTLFERATSEPGMPSLTRLWARLGVRRNDATGEVQLLDDAPLARLRQNLTQPLEFHQEPVHAALYPSDSARTSVP